MANWDGARTGSAKLGNAIYLPAMMDLSGLGAGPSR